MCIFCQIIKGDVPCHKIYEDDNVIVILDHRPVHPGHAMVIPKAHYDYFLNLPDELASHIVLIGNKIARQMMNNLEPTPLRIGHVIHGYFPHVHYHVIPQYGEHDITTDKCAIIRNGAIIFDADLLPIAKEEDQRKIVEVLRI